MNTQLEFYAAGAAGEVMSEADRFTPGPWQPGTNTPGSDGEYEVIDPVTGDVSRATWDSLFEVWSCEQQYPTWRGVA